MEQEKHDIHDTFHALEAQPVYTQTNIMSSEIEEIGEEFDDQDAGNIVNGGSKSSNGYDVYVAVGKDDLEVLRWALDHVVQPGARVNLIHVFPPLSSVITPVGRLWVSQLGPEQIKMFTNEEHQRRRSMLQKYIQLCVDTKVNVDTLLIESNETRKAILDLIPVFYMTSLVMGTKQSPSSRWLIKGSSKGTVVQKNAPDYCKVTLVNLGKKSIDDQRKILTVPSPFSTSFRRRSKDTHGAFEKDFTDCRCFPVKFY